ncbi:uncharacterized protein LOC106655700 [Trichogramma pretiosum]|uniref:uncharacterized protein LOC106655700 n=1 Tax=Trichogramma pretiosum TaxID=7493 RepID=UPI0006C97E14|nr:uncharacterized protein LOC106655700 [Trichogramma pretiosum]XP_014231707.1 uncharacterized protein LOC106655700 [Trichogramma pretiosum]
MLLSLTLLLATAVASSQASMYNLPEANEIMSDRLLRGILERMNGELAAEQMDDGTGRGYLVQPLMSRDRYEIMDDGDDADIDDEIMDDEIANSDKEIPLELPYDYEGVYEQPKTSIRDQEYLRHSSLWSHNHHRQGLDDYKANDRHKIVAAGAKQPILQKLQKQNLQKDPASQLPAYCTPPNPCPVGYTSEHNCIENFENTAAFSRDYQGAQDCMCDSEHMMECPNSIDQDNNVVPAMQMDNTDFDQIVQQLQDNNNPFLEGEKLPIAAKKGLNVY